MEELSTVFVRDRQGRFLFFEHIEFPTGITTPTGHLDIGQSARQAAANELLEEASIRAKHLQLIGNVDMAEDPCSGGADAHRWNIYLERLKRDVVPSISEEEGRSPQWLTLSEARVKPLLLSIRRIIDTFEDKLIATE